MIVIIVTVVVQGIMTPSEARGSFSTPLLTVNTGIFQAIGVISFGRHTGPTPRPDIDCAGSPSNASLT